MSPKPDSVILSKKYLMSTELLKDELRFVIPPVLLEGKITTIFAPAGVGKSTFIYKLVGQWLISQEYGKALVVFSDADYTNEEFKVLAYQYYDPNDLENSRFIPVIPEGKAFYKHLIKEFKSESLVSRGIKLVVIDSLEQLFDVCGVDFHKNIGAFFGVLRRLAMQGVTIVILHHTNKEGRDFSGRSVIANQSDVLYFLRRVGRYKWIGEAKKHRGGKLLGGRIDFYAELTDDGGIEITNDVPDERYGFAVQLIKEVLMKASGKTLKQYEIIQKAQKLASEKYDSEVGKNKIREALKKYDGIYWDVKKGDKGALEYTLRVELIEGASEEELFDSPEEEKKQLLDKLNKLVMIDKVYSADKLPPLEVNGKTYTVLIDIEADIEAIPIEVLREYIKELETTAAIKEVESLPFAF